ncbi:uncharacterized protein LOC143446582 [Clavelina lepadiformis]|uniref:uncharacterized protein LOC143446582 n=1 Tax=Clavelina lepadiformis TaxID=159417 RepID=UPI004043251B
MTLWPELPAASGDVPSASTSQVIRQPRPPPSRGPTFSPRRGPLPSSFVTPPAPTHRRRQFGPQSNDSVLASNEMNSSSSLDREWLYMDTLRSSYSSNNARAMPRRRRNAISGSDRPGRERIRTTNLPDTVQQFLRENNSEELADEYRRWLVEQHISDPDQRVPTPPPFPYPPGRTHCCNWVLSSLFVVFGCLLVLIGFGFLVVDPSNNTIGSLLASCGLALIFTLLFFKLFGKSIRRSWRRRRLRHTAPAIIDNRTSNTSLPRRDLEGGASDRLSVTCTFMSGRPPDIEFDPVVEIGDFSRKSSFRFGSVSSYSTTPPMYEEIFTKNGSEKMLRLSVLNLSKSDLSKRKSSISERISSTCIPLPRTTSDTRWRQRARQTTSSPIEPNFLRSQSLSSRRRTLSRSLANRLYSRANTSYDIGRC